MEWKDLTAFIAVAEQQSFSRAAGQLHITQPGVTRRIGNLERHVGRQLFDRAGKRIYLTDAGRLLLPQARQLINQRTDVERAIRNLSGDVGGRLCVATSHHIGLHHLGPVLREFKKTYPDVQLDIRFEDSEVAHELVRAGTCELAVVTLDPKGSGDLAYEPLRDDPLVFACAADDPLAGTTPTLDVLAAHPAILPGSRTYTGRIVMELFARRGINLSPAMSTNYLETIAMLIGAGLGWSVLPHTMIDPPLAVLEVSGVRMRRELGTVVDPDRTPSNSARAFAASLREMATA